MPINRINYQSALHDFDRAHLQASMQEVLARLTGKTNELLSYDDVAKKLKLHARTDRGIQNIPLNAIIGSVGRYTDFTRGFLPRKETDRERWARVKAKLDDPVGGGLPPIDVYKVGEAYFVLDGNHRVSIARQEGVGTIEAHVIEIKSDIPVTPDLQPDDLIIKAEYAEFLERTGIKNLRPDIDLGVTVPGQYQKLLEHIEVHRHFMGLELQREISYTEAVAHWYDTYYLPFTDLFRERGLLRWFPDRTKTDLYLWVSEHRAALEDELGWDIRPETAMESLAIKENPKAESETSTTGSWRATKTYTRYTDRLFKDILVPLDVAQESWPALEQSVLIAQRESANLYGLYVASSNTESDASQITEAQAQFIQRCQEMGVNGSLATKTGEITDQICEHALLTDLIVLSVSHPPETGLSSLGSGLRTIIRHSARPILTVPEKVSSLDNILIAFDGSDKSKEALFVATYLAEQWKTALAVLTVEDTPKVTSKTQDYARAYLELHEIQAEFILKTGSRKTFLETIEEKGTNLVVMGSYGTTIVQEMVVGSTVNFLLREVNCPILICR